MKALYKVVPRHLIELPLVRPVNIRNLIDRIRFMEMGGGAGTGKKNRKQLVLVDDDSTFLNMASEWLEQAGNYDVAILNSGAQVINYLAKRIPDLILLDYEMPVASGPQVLGMIRSDARFRDIPVFFLTGKNDRDSVMSVMSLKPDGYVIKTAGKQALLEKVNMFFSSRP
ncbi:MAG: response regulator [Lachnospiraceae bacterium]|nr:response regulator [Lachnospiraceae bacterium]